MDEALDEAVPEYQAPGKKSMLEIQQLDPEDESLAKYKQALLGPLPPLMGMGWAWAWRALSWWREGENWQDLAGHPVDTVSPQTQAYPTCR